MNVASLGNCKKLYELSEFDSDDLLHYLDGEIWTKRLFESDAKDKDTYCPAYDLGYLLRKLPDTIEPHGKGHRYYELIAKKFGTENPTYGYYYQYDSFNTGLLDWDGFESNTPEDAAALLAIKLFEEGILVKES